MGLVLGGSTSGCRMMYLFPRPVRKGMPLPDTYSHHTDCTGLADLKGARPLWAFIPNSSFAAREGGGGMPLPDTFPKPPVAAGAIEQWNK
jgi:hypothetical protein